jgi:hypothetical protein
VNSTLAWRATYQIGSAFFRWQIVSNADQNQPLGPKQSIGSCGRLGGWHQFDRSIGRCAPAMPALSGAQIDRCGRLTALLAP